MDEKNKKPPEQGYDGVIYTPGSAANQPSDISRSQIIRKPAPARKAGAKRKKKKQKSQFGIFLAATMFTGVVVVIIVFAVVFNPLLSGSSSSSGNSSASTRNIIAEEPEPILPVASEKTESITGVVKSIGTNSQINVYDFNTGKSLNFIVDNLSILKNKYGEPIVFAEMSAGDIVDVDYSGNVIKELFFSRQSTEYKNISNVKIDMVEQTITIGNETLSYNDQLVTSDKGGDLDIMSIKPLDVVSVRFYKNIVWYLELSKGHGTIDFDNKDRINDGVVEIDNNIIRALDDFEKLEILEGSHRVVVKGSNISPISQEIYIERNASAAIDLSDIELLTGQLVVKVNQSDYGVKINGEDADLSQPIELDYGEYAVTVEKDGYFPWEGTVTISEKTNQLSVELSEKILLCKLSVDSIPSGAEIYIDNMFIGVTPCTANIEYGSHSITYKKEGYLTINSDITLNTPTYPLNLYLQEESPFMP